MSPPDPAACISLEDVPPYIDVNLFCGPCPFRRLPGETPEQLLALMEEARIECAVMTPFSSIFYNVGMDGLKDWLGAFGGDPRVKFWAVLNPAYPGWEEDLLELAPMEAVCGVRLFPRCHGYGLFDPALAQMLSMTSRHRLPVNLAARLVDDRLQPAVLRAGPPLDLEETGALLKEFTEVKWVLSGFYSNELRALAAAVRAHPWALIDVGCSKPFEGWWTEALELFSETRLLLGTGAPLHYHAASRLSLRLAPIPVEARDAIFRHNARNTLFAERSA